MSISRSVVTTRRRTSCQRLRLLRTFAGVLGEKIRMRTTLKENMANYISLESLINVDFGKKI